MKTKYFIIACFSFFFGEKIWGQKLTEPLVILKPEEESKEHQKLLNFNPVFKFGGDHNNNKVITLDKNLSKLTVFTIYRTENPNIEQTVWSLSSNNGKELLTTHNAVDLTTGKILKFQLKHPEYSHINHYYRQKRHEKISPSQFSLGAFYGDRYHLPVVPFLGFIGEVRVYNQLLSRKERQILASYYAIKYGISLADVVDGNYRDSHDNVIWDKNKNEKFHFRIAGLGRDDGTGLNQKQSSSSYAPDLLTISLGELKSSNQANSHIIPDGSFLIWGDNNQNLDVDSESGLGKMTKRKWLWQPSGQAIKSTLNININQRRWSYLPEEKEVMRLCVDKSGSGDFRPEHTVIYLPTNESEDGIVSFNEITAPASTSQIFTFSFGPSMMPIYWIDSLVCQTNEKGTITFGVTGGAAPYQFQLLDETGQEFAKWHSQNDTTKHHITGIKHQVFELEIKDGNGQIERLEINPCASKPVEKKPVTNFVSNYYLSPNPTIDGHFKLTLRLKQESEINCSIVNAFGQTITQQSLRGDNYYETTGFLPVSGSYFIHLTDGQELFSLPIIRQ